MTVLIDQSLLPPDEDMTGRQQDSDPATIQKDADCNNGKPNVQMLGRRPVARKAAAIGEIIEVRGSLATATLRDGQNIPSIGEYVNMPTGKTIACGMVHSVRREYGTDRPIFDLHLVGEITSSEAGRKFSRGLVVFPGLETPVFRARKRDLALIFALPGQAKLAVGEVRSGPTVTANLAIDDLLGKHFAIIGSTGSGKSCAVSVMMHAILKQHPSAHVIIIDPHNEYHRTFGPLAERSSVADLRLPYWMLTFEELRISLIPHQLQTSEIQASILKKALLTAKSMFRSMSEDAPHQDFTVDTPTPYRLGDLRDAIYDQMGKLDKPNGTGPHQNLLNRLEDLTSDRRYRFMFPPTAPVDNFEQVLGKLMRIPVGGKPVTLVDISGVPSEITNVVVSMLSRLVFEFKVWAPRPETPPVLLICEEAHLYVSDNDQGPMMPAHRAIDRIAKEGRKYGIGLGLVSQRPADLSTASLSQCGTIVTLRLTSERDQQFVRRLLPESSQALLSLLPILATGEAVIAGEGTSIPLPVVFNRLPPEHLPDSGTPSFAAAWQETHAGPDVIREAVYRWRGMV